MSITPKYNNAIFLQEDANTVSPIVTPFCKLTKVPTKGDDIVENLEVYTCPEGSTISCLGGGFELVEGECRTKLGGTCDTELGCPVPTCRPNIQREVFSACAGTVSYTHLRAHET